MSVRALLFTDVVDSTLLTQRLGDARARQTWIEHDRRARELLRRHRGREIDRADGFFLLFDAAADAARYAQDYHALLAALDMTARVGLHVGDVSLREIADDDVAQGAKRIEIEGLAKPFAARVMSMAHGGQTLLSDAARRAIGGALDAALQIESHGHYRLKGVAEPVEIFELGAREHCAFTPPRDTDKTYRVVSSGDLWRPLREVRHNLPAERDAFIGRGADLRALAQRLDAGSRLLTLLGPAGTGKTRLARRYGLGWLGDWPGGVYFCDLSEAGSLDGIHFAVAVALAVPLGGGDPGVQLGHAIAGRGRCLLILDNFEQVVEHAQATVGRWLDRAGDAAFVVTSRERLQLPGEEILPVEPLPLDKEAIELFAARAHAQRADFALDGANRDAVAEVVRLLDGLPLAIELAAARVRLLSPAQLVERMRDRFRLLAGVGGAAARQATLRAAIDWSWHLLAPWEQAALAQCSVFEGGFSLLAAEAVLDLSAFSEAPPAMDAVQALVDKSLLRRWVPVATRDRYALDEPYFGMYISIHEYAAEKCRAIGAAQEQAAQQRHGRYFAGFGSDAAIESLSTHGGVKRYRALRLDMDNLVAACRRALARGDGDTAVATYRAAWEVFALQGPLAVGAALGAQVCSLDTVSDSLREAARLTHAEALMRVGGFEGSRAWLAQTLDRVRALGNRRQEGRVLGKLGSLYLWQGRVDEARAHYAAALQIHREVGTRLMEGRTIGNLGISHHEQGQAALARENYEAALAIWQEIGSRRDEGVTLSNLADLLAEQGHFAEARLTFDRALSIIRELGDHDSEAIALHGLAELHLRQGQFDEARALCEASLRLAREMGNRIVEAHGLKSLGDAFLEREEFAVARSYFEQALVILQAVANHRLEGDARAGFGELLFRQGRIVEAAAMLREGERLLRELDDRPLLARLLCIRGLVDAAASDSSAARAALAEAEAAAAALGVGPDSELRRRIAGLREALAAA